MVVKKAVLFDTPVLFFGFNRPVLTQVVFSEIRKMKPKKLYFAVDGPRKSIEDDIEKCQKTRDIISNVDWDCEVKTLFRQENLGCKIAVSSTIDWFFDNEEEGIILEDDCLPAQSFFLFCQEMLMKYRDDERITMISGDNFQRDVKRTEHSYYFSRYTHIWGWASWRRSWQKYDVGIKQWPALKSEKWLLRILQDKKLAKYWNDIFDNVFNNKIDTWDYQLNFACWINNALSIMPNANLVSNIGFGYDASRTTKKGKYSELPLGEMMFPLVHPQIVLRDTIADGNYESDQRVTISIFSKIKNKIRRIIA